MTSSPKALKMKERFRGFLPVVVDVETAGVDPHKNALLEVCIVLITMDEQGLIHRGESYF
ncbi:MAG: exonuclease domain-containing protein, partial [bacterium]|nr:exonuclease domain-containing protein [bacterium]